MHLLDENGEICESYGFDEFGLPLDGYAVLLTVSPNEDYHWYRQDTNGTWSHKMGSTPVITGVENPIKDAKQRGYTSIVGYYYITEACDND